MDSELQVRRVSWAEYEDVLTQLRTAVFVDEQGVPSDITFDGSDIDALHLLVTLDDQPVGCGRLMPEGKVTRMAVLADHRGQGIGRRILEELLAIAREKALPEVYLHAQTQATDFYTKSGFVAEGPEFTEAGIPHVRMTRAIEYDGFQQFITGVHYPRPFDRLAVELARSASRQICILSPRLDHAAFDNRELSEALSALARRGRQSLIRILVSDARPVVQRGHRLLELARRLPTAVKLQRLAEHPDWKGQTVVTRDRDGVLYKPGDSDHEGFYEPNSRASTQRHLDLFEDLWRHSAQDIEFRSLSL